MREIKFRAESISGGTVYGNFIHSKRFEGCSNEFRIHNAETGLESDILIETLGQYVGLKDCKGKEIFEGDIVRWGMINERSYECWHRYAVVEINPDIQFRILYYIIGKTGERKEPDGHIFHYGNFAYKETHNHLEIIGNIYENT